MNGILSRRSGIWALAALLGACWLARPVQAAARKPARKAPKTKTQTAGKPAAKSPKAAPKPAPSAPEAPAPPAEAVPAPATEPPAAVPEAPALPPLDLDQLIAAALANNQELQARQRQISAAQAMVPQARALPDPMVGVMGGGFPTDNRGAVLKAKQGIPGPGKLRLKGEAAELGARRVATDYTEKQREITAEVKKAYYDLYLIDKSIEIAEHNKDLLGDFVRLTQAKYAVGQGLQQDVLRAQVAQSRILDDLLMLHQQRIAAQARLNALLNCPPTNPLGPATTLTRHPVTLSEEALQQTALTQRPMLLGMQLMVAEAQKMVALARQDRKPNYEAEVDVGNGGGMGAMGPVGVRVGLMVEVPLYHREKQDQAVVQRTAEAQAAQSDLEAQVVMVFAMIRDDLSMVQTSDRQIDLYQNGIVPQAELSLESARAGYQVGKVDFLTLLDSQVSLYDDLRIYYRALTDYEKAVADLEQTVGAPLGGGEEVAK
jgi:cobalt-zinc-cadmium efflux system outer membrane protein